MSKFIKKLKEIKNETFHLSELNLSELVDEFDFGNKKDKEFIFGDYKDDKYMNYNSDLHDLLKELEKSELDDDEKKLIIENYKQKYINNSFNRSYCLTYIELFSKDFKTYDFKSLYKELFNSYVDNDLSYLYTIIFQEYNEGEYFIKSFKKYLDVKEKYGGFKYIDDGKITYLNKLDETLFSEFILSLSSYNILVFKKFKEDQVYDFIKKIEDLNSPDINNHLKSILIEIVNDLVKRENYSRNYDYLQLIREYIKSNINEKLSIYLGKIYEDLSIELFKIIKELFLGYWEMVIIIGKIINIKNIAEISNISEKNYNDIYLYEQIEGGTRKDKSELLEEFKKYKGFNEKLKERQKQLKKVQNEDLKRKQKEDDKVNKIIQEIIDKENSKNPPKGINEWLLYKYEEDNNKEFKEREDIKNIVKKQVKRFFKLSTSDPSIYELKYTERGDSSSSYQTHQFVVNRTFLRCLKLYKEFGFKITDNIRDKAIRYVPFTYVDELETIFSIIGEDKIKEEEVKYLLSIYDGTRTKDDLSIHSIQSFLHFYEKYSDSFLKFSKDELNIVLFNIINNTEYRGYERFNTTEKFVKIGEKEQLFELFTKYKGGKNYFNDTLVINEDDYNFKIAILSSKYLLKRFSNFENKKDIVNWYIVQLKTKVNFKEPDFGGVRSISKIESEISWDIDEDNNFIYAFKYINDLSFEDDIKELLKHSFKILEESEDYRVYARYIQKAVFYFYEEIKNKKLKNIFELEKYLNGLRIKNNENRILFKVSYLDKLINLYSEKLKPAEVSKIYKDVYKIEKDYKKENKLLNEKLKIIEEEREKFEKELIKIKEKKINLENELIKYKSEEKDDSVILFVEGKTDKRYLEYAYSNLYNKEFPFKIEVLFGKINLKNYINDIEFLTYTYGSEKTFISLFDFDSAYNDFNGTNELKEFKNEINKYIRKKEKCYAFLLPANNVHSEVKKNIFIEGNETKGNFKGNSELEIEHLFYGIDSKVNEYYEYKNFVGGGKVLSLKGNKVKFCNFILGNTPKELKILDKLFDNFKPIFEIINEIIEDSKKSQKS